ncbi:MAG TPA: DUF305 domain-containing protein [Gemmatimonadales bacterium]|nr:DUF305 domain-containing protein [Gemmatimonadales bacterium]
MPVERDHCQSWGLTRRSLGLALLVGGVALAACSSATGQQPPPPPAPAPQTAPNSARSAYTEADVRFMSGMIHHHAQALVMAGWAPTHGASSSVLALCERIVVGQGDEIALIQRWLRDRHEPVPQMDSTHHMMGGMDHAMMMPGMLTAEQLARLDGAKGPAFDRLFLTSMIEHHKGALTMVDQLFASQGAGEEEGVFRFASDVYADQSTEIDRMQRMLVALPPEAQSP